MYQNPCGDIREDLPAFKSKQIKDKDIWLLLEK